jgi:hypothetical protein
MESWAYSGARIPWCHRRRLTVSSKVIDRTSSFKWGPNSECALGGEADFASVCSIIHHVWTFDFVAPGLITLHSPSAHPASSAARAA